MRRFDPPVDRADDQHADIAARNVQSGFRNELKQTRKVVA